MLEAVYRFLVAEALQRLSLKDVLKNIFDAFVGLSASSRAGEKALTIGRSFLC
jgi:hypothetical protein